MDLGWPAGRGPRSVLGWTTCLAVIGILHLGVVESALGQGRGGLTSVQVEFSNAADQLLRTAASHVQAKQWSEALDLYQRVIQQFGETVAPVPKDDPEAPAEGLALFVDVRSFCQRRIAAMPAEAREIYRKRVDAQAERWWKRGIESRDRASLRRVVDETFCSSWGDDALEALGDLAFQDGHFAEALEAYRRLAPVPGVTPAGLVHPDPSVELARIEAKALLCRAAHGDRPPTPDEVEAFAKAYPEAVGSLAGRSGKLAEIVRAAMTDDHLAPASPLDTRWSTYAGSPTRSRALTEEVDVGSPHWSIGLQKVPSSRNNGNGNNTFARAGGNVPVGDAIAAYHPIVLGDQVIVADDRTVRSYHLDERPRDASQVLWQYPPQGPAFDTPVSRRPPHSARYSLTAAGDRIFARMSGTGRGSSAIVGLDRNKEGKFLWKVLASDLELPRRPNNGQRPDIAFEAAPVADLQNVYVGLSEAGPRVATWIACLAADTGRPRWIRYVCDASYNAPNPAAIGGINAMGLGNVPSDAGLRMLTLDEGSLYFQTNLGALACLDAESGQVRWVTTYPTANRMAIAVPDRDLSPAIVHDGLVYVAASDSSILSAFEVSTGRLAWKSEPLKGIEHLLGVAKGRLFATGDRVWSFDAKDGKLLSTWPDSLVGFKGAGRGLLAGDHLYWPTEAEIHVIDQATGHRARQRPPIPMLQKFQQPGGNLIAGDGYLIVTSLDSLAVYSQNSRLLRRYRDQIALEPARAIPYYHLAQVAESVGDDDDALKALEDCLERAKPGEFADSRPLIEAARGRRFDLLLKLGDREAKAGRWDAATRRFIAAATSGPNPADRLTAQLRLADAQAELGQPVDVVKTLQGLLADDAIRGLSVPVDPQRTVRADLRIADRLTSLIREHGRSLYAEYDAAADRLLESGLRDRDSDRLEQVARAYPAALHLPDALLASARIEREASRPASASRTLRRLLREPIGQETRAAALLELGRSYEAQQLWSQAYGAYETLRGGFGTIVLETPDGKAAAADLVAERLRRGPANFATGPRGRASLELPLSITWSTRWDAPQRLVGAEGDPPSTEVSHLFLAEGVTVRPLKSADGSSPWAIGGLSGPAEWVGFIADRLVVGTPDRIVAVRATRGDPAWSFDAGPGEGAKPDPFVKELGHARRPDAKRLHGFRIVGDRLVCLRGDREILAIDAESGALAWSFTPAADRINSWIAVDARHLLLQTLRADRTAGSDGLRPSSVTVLATDDGRVALELAEPESALAWTRPPLPLDDDHAVIPLGPKAIRLLDVRRGNEAWRFTDPSPLPRGGMPRMLVDGDALLVLFGGQELVRLDAGSGRKVWSCVLGTEEIGDRPASLVVDGRRVYFANGATLGCLSLDGGRTLWSRDLGEPSSGWTLAVAAAHVLAYPSPIRGSASEADGLPLLVVRREDGRLIQRVVVPADAQELAVRLGEGGTLVATQAGLWSLGGRPSVDEGTPRR